MDTTHPSPTPQSWHDVPAIDDADLLGPLTLAGVPGPDALAATLLYRLVSYWLPIPVGGVAYLLFRRNLSGQEDQHRSRG